MDKAPASYTVEDHFAGKGPTVRAVYDRLLAAVRKFGPVREDAKKTSIHLTRSSALAGVQVRKAHLVLTIKASRPFDSPRVLKSDQASANRYHHQFKLTAPADVDRELQAWLKEAYDLGA
jgi:Domain of unknown function (DUF5655)